MAPLRRGSLAPSSRTFSSRSTRTRCCTLKKKQRCYYSLQPIHPLSSFFEIFKYYNSLQFVKHPSLIHRQEYSLRDYMLRYCTWLWRFARRKLTMQRVLIHHLQSQCHMMELSKKELVGGRMDASIVEFHGAYRRMRLSNPHPGRRRRCGLRFAQK